MHEHVRDMQSAGQALRACGACASPCLGSSLCSSRHGLSCQQVLMMSQHCSHACQGQHCSNACLGSMQSGPKKAMQQVHGEPGQSRQASHSEYDSAQSASHQESQLLLQCMPEPCTGSMLAAGQAAMMQPLQARSRTDHYLSKASWPRANAACQSCT